MQAGNKKTARASIFPVPGRAEQVPATRLPPRGSAYSHAVLGGGAGPGKPRSLLTQGAAAAASAQERTRGTQPRVQRTQRLPRPARPLPPPRATASLPQERGNSHLASGSFHPAVRDGKGWE